MPNELVNLTANSSVLKGESHEEICHYTTTNPTSFLRYYN